MAPASRVVMCTSSGSAAKWTRARSLNANSGARGLRSLLESIMLDAMYEAPRQRGAKHYVISEKTVTGQENILDTQPLPKEEAG